MTDEEPPVTATSAKKECEENMLSLPLIKTERYDDISDHQSPEHNGGTESAPATFSNSIHRISQFRIGVEEKSNMLNHAWSELSNILGQYRAELFCRDEATQKYESKNDLTVLKDELINKDSEISHLRQQLEEVQHQCEQIQRHNEQCQMDLSVKDTLLKKYQDDLLLKEADLMTAQTKISRLENRLRMLESRVGASVERRPLRHMVTPRLAPTSRMGRGGAMMGRSMPPSLMQSRKRASLPNTPVKPIYLARPSPVKRQQEQREQEPVVCIEVDDDDVRQVVDQASQSLTQDASATNLYGHESFDTTTSTDTTDLQSLPGGSLDQSLPGGGLSQSLPVASTSALDVNRPMLVQDEYGEDLTTGQQEEDWSMAYEQQHLQQQEQHQQQTTQAQTSNKVPTNKPKLVWPCPNCDKHFGKKYHRDRHFNEVHQNVIKFVCPYCSRGFVRREHFQRHLLTHRGRLPQNDPGDSVESVGKADNDLLAFLTQCQPEQGNSSSDVK